MYAENIFNVCNFKPPNSGIELAALKNINIIYHTNSISAYPKWAILFFTIEHMNKAKINKSISNPVNKNKKSMISLSRYSKIFVIKK